MAVTTLSLVVVGVTFVKAQQPQILPASDGTWALAASPAIDGNASNAAGWNMMIDGWKGEAPGFFTEEAVSFSAQGAALTVSYPAEAPAEDCACAARSVALGLVSSKQQFQYGFFEASVQIADADGITSSFWLQGASGEINVLDYTRGNPTGSLGAHCFGADKGDGDISKKVEFDATDAVQTGTAPVQVYGVDWSSEAIKFYQDGVLTATLTASDDVFACLNQPMNVIMSTEVAASSVPEGLGTTTMEVSAFQYWTTAESEVVDPVDPVVEDDTEDKDDTEGEDDTEGGDDTEGEDEKGTAPNTSGASSAFAAMLAATVGGGIAAMLV